MKKIFFILLLLSTINSCRVYDKLTIDKIDYLGISPRIDGYYYDNNEINSVSVLFFYRNGVFLNFSFNLDGWDKVKMNKNEYTDKKIEKIANDKFIYNTQYVWGLYQIYKTKIIIEKWLTGVGGPYPVGRYNGIFLNDTTLSLAISDHPPDINDPVKTFNFRFLSCKPDSTNRFIK